jgi:hypothetical protein
MVAELITNEQVIEALNHASVTEPRSTSYRRGKGYKRQTPTRILDVLPSLRPPYL